MIHGCGRNNGNPIGCGPLKNTKYSPKATFALGAFFDTLPAALAVIAYFSLLKNPVAGKAVLGTGVSLSGILIGTDICYAVKSKQKTNSSSSSSVSSGIAPTSQKAQPGLGYVKTDENEGTVVVKVISNSQPTVENYPTAALETDKQFVCYKKQSDLTRFIPVSFAGTLLYFTPDGSAHVFRKSGNNIDTCPIDARAICLGKDNDENQLFFADATSQTAIRFDWGQRKFVRPS